MAARGILSVNSPKTSWGLTRALVSAVLEWFLIFMLLIDAIFSYLITKFAQHCELQIPCLLCSRLDHILGNEKLKYYWDLICRSHKLEISSLVFCHAHNKLVDVHGMCESCLFSFATVNKSNAETYRLLVGKLGEESDIGFDQDPLLEGHKLGRSATRHCSCCNEPWISGAYAQKFIQTKSTGSEATELDVPLLGALGHNQDDMNKIGKPSMSVIATHRRNSGLDPLSHVGYAELKITSDTESEQFSDDDDASALIRETKAKEYLVVQHLQLEPRIITLSGDSALEKLIDPVSVPEPSLLVSQVQSDVIESHAGTSVAPTVALGHGLEELRWQQTYRKADPSTLTELISLEDVPSSSNCVENPIEASEKSKLISLDEVPPSTTAGETSVDASKENELISLDDVPPPSTAGEILVDVSKESKLITVAEVPPLTTARETPTDTSKESELISLDYIPPPSTDGEIPVDVSKESKLMSLDDVPSSNAVETAVEVSKENCVPRTSEIGQTSTTECEEICKVGSGSITTTETAMETNPVSSDTGLQVPNLMNLSDAYKLAVGNRGRQSSGVLAEQWTGKDSSRLSEDLKLLLSQLSTPRGFELSMNDISPKVSLNSDEMKTPDASGSIGMHMLQRKISLERNESGLSLDGSIISEIEGESVVDRLKRQVEHDRKLLNALYKELEEERNASTIAANQAMAMITRVQEEKATLHMEALQSLRMMEEQAEYDMEALNKANDLLAEKEKEMQDLEAELEFYREKFPNESMLENMVEPNCDLKVRDIRVDHSEATCVEDGAIDLRKSDMSFVDKNTSTVTDSLLEFEDERLYISQRLKKLEKKLYLFSSNGIYSDLANGEYSENEGDSVSGLKKLNIKGGSQVNSGIEENDLSMQNDVSVSRGSLHAQENKSSQVGSKESEQSSPVPCGGTDLASLGNEVSELNERLEALEADRNFLEHTINSLRNGEDGLRFIQEIASHLQELRRIGIRRNQPVA